MAKAILAIRFLMAALNRAIAFAKMPPHFRARRPGSETQCVGILDIFLDVYGSIVETPFLPQPGRPWYSWQNETSLCAIPHAPPTSTCNRFNYDWISDLLATFMASGLRVDGPSEPGTVATPTFPPFAWRWP